MPDLTSAALFERDGKVLVAHRRRPPFAGQWLLPMTLVRDDEAAEDALRRHAEDQFGIGLGDESFVETVYLTDPDDQRHYVANIFRTPLGEGPMRFNAGGDYDDARWSAPAELDDLWIPPDLRVPLVKILTEPESLHETDWSQAMPLEAREASALDAAPPPDNRASWDAIAKAWQDERYGDRFGTKLMWSWRASEDDLHVLGNVRGKRAIVLGCGGGQDAVALEKLGATVVGIDTSPKQLAYARGYAQRNSADNVSFVECALEDLSRFDDASFDLAVSILVFDYVERLGEALAEAARVLKPGGVLAIAVKHPLDVIVDAHPYEPLYRVVTSYWTGEQDRTLSFKDGTEATLRAYFRTVEQWFDALAAAGFTAERIIEPKEGALPRIADELDNHWMSLMPYTLVLRARKR